ncbi:MAG: FtsX-like permease family protein, partial [bacterium]|nr:FtsX-like permease family protein [bacterium]
MDPIRQDLKYAVRALKKDRGFTITAVLTLALVLAANVAIFSVVNSVLLQPLPHPESDRLVTLFNSYPNSGVERASNGAPDFFDRRQYVEALEEVASYRGRGYALGIDGVPHRIRALQVTPSFFPVLRAEPRLGRSFIEAEGEVGNDGYVILSHALAQQLFGDESRAIGQALPLDGVTHQVIGVMAPEFVYLNSKIQMWTPQSFTEDQKQSYHSNSWSMVGRLAHGATIEQARAQVDALNARNIEQSQFADLLIEAGFHTKILSLQEDFVSNLSGTLYLLWVGVAFVLLIGCVNVANLSLVRASVRLRELSMRVVLGAGKVRVARQLITETTLVAVTSAVIGLCLGWAGIRAFTALGMEQLPRGTEVGIDGSVALVTLAAALISGLVLGLIPVVYVMRVNTSLLLRAEGRSSTAGRRAQLTRRVLVAIQVAT